MNVFQKYFYDKMDLRLFYFDVVKWSLFLGKENILKMYLKGIPLCEISGSG